MLDFSSDTEMNALPAGVIPSQGLQHQVEKRMLSFLKPPATSESARIIRTPLQQALGWRASARKKPFFFFISLHQTTWRPARLAEQSRRTRGFRLSSKSFLYLQRYV